MLIVYIVTCSCILAHHRINWVAIWENGSYVICEQHVYRSTCATSKLDQGVLCSLSYLTVYSDSEGGQPTHVRSSPASILYKSIAGRFRPVSYPDGPITARYRFIKMDTLPMLATISTLFLSPFSKRIYFLRIKFAPNGSKLFLFKLEPFSEWA